MKDVDRLAMRITFWAIPLLTIGIFVFDMVTPVGVTVAILYVIPLLLTHFTARERSPIYFCIVVTGLLWIDLFLKPQGSPIPYGMFNRAMGTSVLWIIALGLVRFRQMHLKTTETQRELISERVERAHAEGLMRKAQEARYHADREAMRATVGREEVEGQLLVNQLRLEGIIESAMDAIITVDEDQRVVLFNRAAEEMFGYPTRETIGQPLDRFLPARFREAHRHHVRMFGQSDVTSRKMGKLGTVMGFRMSGEEFPIEAAISHVTVERKTYYTVILRDITERKRMEELVVRSMERLTLATRAADIGVWDWDISKNELVWDDRMFALYGVKKEDFGGAYDAWLSGVHPDDRARCDEAIQQALHNKKPYDIEFRVQWPDGTVHIIKADGLVAWDPQGRPLRMTGTNYDISVRKQVEHLLRQSEERYRRLIAISPYAILVNRDNRIIFANDQAIKLFGAVKADEILGKSPLDLFHPDCHAVLRERIHELLEGRQLVPVIEEKIVRVDGTSVDVEASAARFVDEEGTAVLVMLRDVSERKRLQAQLRKTERVAELGTLASGMAHEIGTPMNVILGRAEYLMDRVAEEPIKKGLQTIVTQVERITKVMNQLLSFARRKTPERCPLDLRGVIEDSVEIFQERLSRNQVHVEMALADSCPMVLADADQMGQIMINLIMNALHAMEDGGTLRIRMVPEKDMVKLTVADTGHGIPRDLTKKIFEPFFTTKEFGKGTGLGLTVVKGIIEEHQGSIAVESEEGKGTMFTILLPIADRQT